MEALRKSKIKVIHNYHEQACVMAAEGYTRISGVPSLVLVTNGPGVSNSLTGVLGAFQDSVPMIILSGQVPLKHSIHFKKSKLRQLGIQEVETIELVKSITKSAVQVSKVKDLERIVNESWNTAVSGRPGPVWIEVPLDVQADLVDFLESKVNAPAPIKHIKKINDSTIKKIYNELQSAKKPIIVAGSGIRASANEGNFLKLIKHLKIPVASTWNASDLFDWNDELYIGNFGILGQRNANISIQNSDYLLVLGSRLSIPNVGHSSELFAPNAKITMVDIDLDELNKNTLKIFRKVHCDLGYFITRSIALNLPFNDNILNWKSILLKWKKKFSVFNEQHEREKGTINSYDFIEALSNCIPEKSVVITDMGTSFTCTMQAMRNNGINRLFTSSGTSSMGFGLPGAIGAAIADPDSTVICIAGDGGFLMNIQELQTIKHNNLNIKMFILNSNGYLAISVMQDHLFNGAYFGSNSTSGISAPNFIEVAQAFGIHSEKIQFDFSNDKESFSRKLNDLLSDTRSGLYEITLPKTQNMKPRVRSKKTEDGKITSGSIDVMWPFLDDATNMDIVEDLKSSSN
jgi:acetolactate synthase-1/2/3 large subunit